MWGEVCPLILSAVSDLWTPSGCLFVCCWVSLWNCWTLKVLQREKFMFSFCLYSHVSNKTVLWRSSLCWSCFPTTSLILIRTHPKKISTCSSDPDECGLTWKKIIKEQRRSDETWCERVSTRYPTGGSRTPSDSPVSPAASSLNWLLYCHLIRW